MSGYTIGDEDDLPFTEDATAARFSRNSTGAKEEFGPTLITPGSRTHSRASVNSVNNQSKALLADLQKKAEPKQKDERMLLIVFVLMVIVGLGNKVFNKLMTIPMYNYPNFLNLLTTFIFVPVCFAYIIPMAKLGYIPKEQLEMPKKPFAIMGALDAAAGIMSIFAVTYLPGPLIILLQQSAIPVSMILSKFLLKVEYSRWQYLGALIVAGGIMVVLGPLLSGGGSPLWACMIILSTIPMALSSVYKEIALGETELDPVYLNGWIAVFQLVFSLILCVPLSYASEPPVPAADLPNNIWQGMRCYIGVNSQTCSDDGSCVADNCDKAPEFVNIYLFFNQLYNLLIILILKYGSANLFFMAMTLMVPLGNVAFTLPFVPGHQPLRPTDIIGLVVIMAGLICYRFASQIYDKFFPKKESLSYKDEEKNALFSERESLVADLMTLGDDNIRDSKL